MDGYGVLKVGCGLAVTSDDCPAVGQDAYLPAAHCYHWLDGYAESILYLLAIAAAAIAGHHWVFVHLAANAMTAELSDDSVGVAFTMVLNGVADIAYPASCQCCLDAQIEAFLGGLEQLPDLGGYLADTECVA